jgi:hypothetical protein
VGAGINPIEKALLKQRLANLPTAQGGYIEKQKKRWQINKGNANGSSLLANNPSI